MPFPDQDEIDRKNLGCQCSPAEYAFARTYAATGSKSASARAAGCTARDLCGFANTLLLRPPVQQEIARVRRQARERHQEIVDWLVRELAAIAGANLAELVDDSGALRKLSEVAPEVQATIAEYSRDPGEFGDRVRVKQHSKMEALKTLCRVMGLERTTIEHQIMDGEGKAAHLAQARTAIERALFTEEKEETNDRNQEGSK